jgi:hypothetical protein
VGPRHLSAEPVASRITGSTEWLSVHLLDHDLIVVGYFTDWDYLNAVLDRTVGDVRPARVLIIDPSDATDLARKAPALLGKTLAFAISGYRQPCSWSD